MKTLILASMFILVSCGNLTKEREEGHSGCRTLEEQRAMCFVVEMEKLGHDVNMTDWVKNQCAIIYATQGCYTTDHQ